METTPDDRLKAQCAKDILAMTIATNKEISQDQMQRLIAEIKLNRAPQTKQIPVDSDDDTEDKPSKPVVDFSVIRTLE